MALLASGVATLLIARERDAANANYQMAQENLDIAYQILDENYVATAETALAPRKGAHSGTSPLLGKDADFL